MSQVDLRHIDELNGTNIVEVGVDLSEFYTSVEWDILEVPAVRYVTVTKNTNLLISDESRSVNKERSSCLHCYFLFMLASSCIILFYPL